jgi:hypothetical protein
VQLVPGDAFTALARTANALADTDLIVISADQDAAALDLSWFYLPRMLHAASQVVVARQGPGPEPHMQLLDLAAVRKLADDCLARRRRAA